jgi:F-type H+-transporting ATPase subunit alpha
LRLNLAQFRELAAFTQFGTDLDAETKGRINRGQRLTELLKQPQYTPLSVWEQTAILMPATEGVFDDVPVEKLHDAVRAMIAELWSDHKKDMQELNKGDKPSDEMKKLLLDTAKKVAKGYQG